MTSSPTRTVTKQSETRSSVLDLIERLGVGDAIPSERQLSAELGVSRLTVRAALDDLVRDGMLVRRHGSGTFVSEPKIAQELTMTSFTEDMQRRGMVPASRTLDLRVTPAGAHLGRLLHVSPSEPVVIISRLRLADRETMAIETLHVRESLVPGSPRRTSSTSRSTSSCKAVTGSRSSAACRRSSRRSPTRRSPMRSACRSTRLPSSSSARRAPRTARSSSSCARSTGATDTSS